MQNPLIVSENVDRLRAMTDDQIKGELGRCLGKTTAAIVETAQCVFVLEERGVDLSDIRNPWLDIIRRVAHGNILPEIITKVTDARTFERVASLPKPDQKLIAEDKPIKVAVGQRENGEVDHRLLTLDKMTPEQKNNVFGKGRIRSPEEQWQRITAKKTITENTSVTLNLSTRQFTRLAKIAEKQKKSIATVIIDFLESGDMI